MLTVLLFNLWDIANVFISQLSSLKLVNTLGNSCIAVHTITVQSLEIDVFIHPSSSVCLLLSCLQFPSSGIIFFLCDGRNGRHRNSEPMAEWEEDWERKGMREIQKEGGRANFKVCTSSISASQHFSAVFSWSFSWSFHLLLLPIPPALFLILHLSPWVLELRASYTSSVWQTHFMIHT